MYTLLIPVYAFLFLPILSTIGGDARTTWSGRRRCSGELMICVFCISHVPLLLNLHVPGMIRRATCCCSPSW
jgi:phosphatidate cytidylyltransferase